MERKLAAIFSTDVKGYSRLMGDDEEATIRTIKVYREVISGLIEQHHGRVVDSPGDNMLAEFPSAVDAVKSSVAIQHELKTRNAKLDTHRQMEFRIGLNVGDVITDEGRLYGDGVNIAARLEGLADPGGICISESVHTHVQNKLAFQYAYIGEREVKNIAKPVPVYKVQLEADGTTAAARTGSQERPAPRPVEETGPSRRWSLAGLAVVAVLLVAGGVLLLRPVSQQPSSPPETGVTEETPALPLPDKPSLAVLPFTNMSGDPEQEYFSDGMTEDIITDLSKISGLFVIARNSTFTYKGQAVDISAMSRKLGVRYVLEGSVRKAQNHVRINAQLIDATTGGHVWAERYDRELADIFALQDEITEQIVTTLRVEVRAAEQERVRRVPTLNLSAYDAWLRGVEYAFRETHQDRARARQLFERAIALDPQYARAYAALGRIYAKDWILGNLNPSFLTRARELADRAIALDDTLPEAHALLGYVYLQQKQPKQALAEAERALALDAKDADTYVALAEILSTAGRPEEVIAGIPQAMRRNPHYPAAYPYQLGWAYYVTGQYKEAIAAMQETLRLNPNFPTAYLWIAVSYKHQWSTQLSQDPQTLACALVASQQQVALTDSVYWAHGNLGYAYLWLKQYDKALVAAERAVALNPHSATSHLYVGRVLSFAGRAEEGLARIEQVSSSPNIALAHAAYFLFLGNAYYLTGRSKEALAAYRQALTLKPAISIKLETHLGLAVSYSELGQQDKASAEIAEVLTLRPQFSLEGVRQRWPFQDPADLERFVANLQKAGLE